MKARQNHGGARTTALICFALWALTFTGYAAAQTGSQPTPSPSAMELARQYDAMVQSIRSVNVTGTMTTAARGTYEFPVPGEEKITANIVAQRPARMRFTGETAVGNRSFFDAVTDGSTVQMYIPVLRTLFEGDVDSSGTSRNLLRRPSLLLEAFFWPTYPPESEKSASMTRNSDGTAAILSVSWVEAGKTLTRKVWFDPLHWQISSIQTISGDGTIQLLLTLSDWTPVTARGDNRSAMAFPKRIQMTRPGGTVEIVLSSISLNEQFPPSRFQLQVPPGTRTSIFSNGITPTR